MSLPTCPGRCLSFPPGRKQKSSWGNTAGIRWSCFINELLGIYQNNSKDVVSEDVFGHHYYSKSVFPMSASPPDSTKNICWIMALNFYRINWCSIQLIQKYSGRFCLPWCVRQEDHNPEKWLDGKGGKCTQNRKIQNAWTTVKQAFLFFAELTQESLHYFLLSLSTYKTSVFWPWPWRGDWATHQQLTQH